MEQKERIFDLIKAWQNLREDGLTTIEISYEYYNNEIGPAQLNRGIIDKYLEELKSENRIFSHTDFNGKKRYKTYV
jgi:hypothetical protein